MSHERVMRSARDGRVYEGGKLCGDLEHAYDVYEEQRQRGCGKALIRA